MCARTAAFNVNVKNQLTSVGRSSCTYDTNGNLTFSALNGVAYGYNAENQLISVDTASNWRTEWVYDGRGRLRIRREYTWMSGWVLNSETRYVYDGMRVIQERNSSNTPTVSYTRGTDLSGGLEGAGGIGGLLARSHGYSSGTWSGHNFYHADGGGNVTMLIDNAGTPNVTVTYRYDPFGNTITTTGTNAANNVYRFSSKERHANTGIYYYGYRFYDPNLQRWPNRDPINELGFQVLHQGAGSATGSSGPNLYTFVSNEPVSAMDPFGLSLWVCTSRASGIIGINHAYMWDDRKETPKGQRDCSMQGSSGKRNTHDDSLKGPKPGVEPGWDIWYGPPDSGVRCERIPNSNGKEADAIKCCRDKANKGVWFPGLNDCHNPLDKCLKDAGISPRDIPPHKRFGKNRGVE